MTIAMFGSLIGGVGLFLLGMRLMTDGLKYAAGNALRSILESSTSTRLRGIFSGAFITALIQSSGAVAVATIGFVNAGLMDFGHAVPIIYGTNIGTTMTGWLVSIVGFQFNIKAFAIPAVGIGMVIRLIRHDSRYGAMGDVLAGFGIFFLGIDILKDTFSGVGAGMDVAAFAGDGMSALVLFVGIGFLLTFLMQSSSASIAIIMTAVAGDAVTLMDAAAAVIGANVGTTTTAAISVVGASADAKRLAGAHVFFNLITGVVALCILPFLIHFLEGLEDFFGIQKTPATLLALFHTTFNLLGVMILYPFTYRLVAFLKRCWHTTEEDEAIPRYLSKNVIGTPVLALQSMAMELQRVGEYVRRMARGAISSEEGPSPRLRMDRAIVDKLLIAVEDFSNQLQRSNIPADLDAHLPSCLRVIGYYRAVAELSVDISQMLMEDYHLERQPDLAELVAHFKKDVVKFVEMTDNSKEDFDVEARRAQIEEIKQAYRGLKLKLLQSASRGQLQVSSMVHFLDVLARIRRVAEQAEKGGRYLYEVRSVSYEEKTFEPVGEALI